MWTVGKVGSYHILLLGSMGNMVKNKQEATGEEMAAMPKDLMIGIKMRWYHMYNT